MEKKMINKLLIIVFFFLISKPVLSENYFVALDFFNKKQISKSIQLFQKVASNSESSYQDKAIFNLAVIYDNGYGVRADKTKALYYYNIASDMNNEFAMYNLGWMYQVGENLNKDAVRAFELYTKSAEKGHPQATFNLANMYYSGEGTTKDLETAYRLFLESKIRGIKESEYYIKLISSDLSFEEMNYLNEENKKLIEKKIDLPAPPDE
jgi:TPR repeat protein